MLAKVPLLRILQLQVIIVQVFLLLLYVSPEAPIQHLVHYQVYLKVHSVRHHQVQVRVPNLKLRNVNFYKTVKMLLVHNNPSLHVKISRVYAAIVHQQHIQIYPYIYGS